MNLPANYHDMTPRERKAVREEYIKRQEGRCQHCHTKLDEPPPPAITKLPIKKKLFPPAFFKFPVHLHHDHDTGMTIGAVHCKCNAVLWQYHDK